MDADRTINADFKTRAATGKNATSDQPNAGGLATSQGLGDAVHGRQLALIEQIIAKGGIPDADTREFMLHNGMKSLLPDAPEDDCSFRDAFDCSVAGKKAEEPEAPVKKGRRKKASAQNASGGGIPDQDTSDQGTSKKKAAKDAGLENTLGLMPPKPSSRR